MARLRHFAVCVRDLEKSANFYAQVFGLKEVGRETIEIGSPIYMSDGVINLALLNFAGKKGTTSKIRSGTLELTILVFRSMILPRRSKRSRRWAASSFSTSVTNAREISNASSRTPMGSSLIFPEHGWVGTDGRKEPA